jgi:outer membrane protein assembly factor BamA
MKILIILLLLSILGEPSQMMISGHNFSMPSQGTQSDDEIPIVIQCGQVTVQGSEHLTQPELCRFLERVSQSPLDSAARNSDGDSLLNEYHRRGFLEASLNWKEAEKKADASTNTFVLQIHEGPVYLLRRLDMLGNATTRDRVIRRRLALQEGDAFEEDLLELSIKRINELGIFEEFTRENVEVVVNKKKQFVDLTFKVRE